MHFMKVCPRLLSFQNSLEYNKPKPHDAAWSVRDLLDFSYNPGINEAFEGTWQSGDPLPLSGTHDASFDLGWLVEEEEEMMIMEVEQLQ